MKTLILLTALISTAAFANNNIPSEAMMNVAAFIGSYKPVNCLEKNIKDGVEQKVFACEADLVQFYYSHVTGVVENYFFTKQIAKESNLVYGRMAHVAQVGCRDTGSLDSTECFDVKPGFFAQNIDYKEAVTCGEQEVVNTTKWHWELKKVANGVDMLVHEDIFFNNCSEEGKLEAPMIMTKDLTVHLNPIK